MPRGKRLRARILVCRSCGGKQYCVCLGNSPGSLRWTFLRHDCEAWSTWVRGLVIISHGYRAATFVRYGASLLSLPLLLIEERNDGMTIPVSELRGTEVTYAHMSATWTHPKKQAWIE
ncbi:hypothetical protein Mal52_57280 [Symmachiella dynata]|uniref:Uncharacterized protein n=1 Tax=Symmachiella dynata TaxID=2527995 RepID=A0A517ZXK9_9PLAN|nr:hypothetical protein Mal52_57280 [Symmachiella dynata]